MSIDVLIEEVREMPESLIMSLVRYARELKSDYGLGSFGALSEADRNNLGTSAALPDGKIRRAGILKGQIKMTDDFDAPLDDFEDYM